MSTAVIKKIKHVLLPVFIIWPPQHTHVIDCKCDCELHNVRIEKFSVIIDDIKLYRVRLNYVYNLHTKFC